MMKSVMLQTAANHDLCAPTDLNLNAVE